MHFEVVANKQGNPTIPALCQKGCLQTGTTYVHYFFEGNGAGWAGKLENLSLVLESLPSGSRTLVLVLGQSSEHQSPIQCLRFAPWRVPAACCQREHRSCCNIQDRRRECCFIFKVSSTVPVDVAHHFRVGFPEQRSRKTMRQALISSPGSALKDTPSARPSC